MSEHTISELSALSGLPVRTIRFYLAQGLIPAAGKEGPGTRYPGATLARLRLIARLRDAHLPLAEIRKQLLGLSDDEALALAGTPSGPDPAGTALDYIRSVLGSARSELAPPPVPSAPAPGASPTPPPVTRPVMPAPATPVVARSLALRRLAEATPAVPAPTPEDGTAFGQRSQWERVSIATDIELHVRRPLSRRDNRLVERLLAFARQLQEEQP